MYITFTQRFIDYVEDGCEWVFTPQVWCLTDDDEHEPLFELTEEGRKLAEEYLEDSSCGYDLGYGRAKGLAQDYTDTQMMEFLISNPLYVTDPVAKGTSIYEFV